MKITYDYMKHRIVENVDFDTWKKYVTEYLKALDGPREGRLEYWYYHTKDYTWLHHPDYIRHWVIPVMEWVDNKVVVYHESYARDNLEDYFKEINK